MDLRILMRKQQLYNKLQQPVILSGTNPQSIITTLGTLTPNDWQDVTDECSDLTKLKLTWTEEDKSAGDKQNPLGNNFKKTATSTLTFEGDTFRFIRAWLWDDIAAPLNAIEVKILDTSCGYYEDWNFRNNQIRYCENQTCEFNINLKQKDELFHCIQNTLINDNWQGWYQIVPLNGKKHPRFSYCNEQRPNGMMIVLWWLMGSILGPLVIIMVIVLAIIALIAAIINAIISVINALGGNLGFLNVPNPLAIFDSMTIYYLESAGCGREHPFSLVRDYITNVCDKCGIVVDDVTAPIFFAQSLTVETSDPNRGTIQATNPYYNLAYGAAEYKRGIRRFKSINVFGTSGTNTSDFWIPDNNPNIALSDLLDQLSPVFNADWRIRNGKLYFWRKDWFKNGNPVYDFTANSADRLKLIDGICYEWNEVKYPAYIDGLYSTDPSDSCGNEALGQMNGDAYAFTQYEDQPNFGGGLDKRVQFGGTRFNLDGAQTCYYMDAMQVVANGGALNPSLPFQMAQVAQKFSEYADYALLLRDETFVIPKLLIWDGLSYLNARAIRIKSAYPNVAPFPTPQANPAYNITSQPWEVLHYPQTFVIGSSLTVGTVGPGIYQVDSLFGSLGPTITSKPAILINYPMYFEPGFYDTLWDWFHWIDDPRGNPLLNQRFMLKIAYCCEDAKILGLLNDATDIQLGQLIKIPASSYFQSGKIKEITLSFDGSEEYGRSIEIRGEV